MIVDPPIASVFSAGSSLEDFLHMDMLAGPAAGPSSSRSSSNSPSNSFAELPITPPNPFDISTSEFFPFYLEDELSKVDPYAVTSAAPFDFLGAFPMTDESSPDSGASPSSGASPVTINPQVVTTPSVSGPMSEFDDEEEPSPEDEEDLDDGDIGKEEEELSYMMPLKVGGKGKNRKGTVQSGGIAKKLADKKKDAKAAGMLSTTSIEPDDWRPTPEEYKKMSSKEKRQLRNKISARNFRVRRKGTRQFVNVDEKTQIY